VQILGVNEGSYYEGIVSALSKNDYLIKMCFWKSVIFAFIIATICSYKGYYVMLQKMKGALGVSAATTQAVVVSSVNILLWDYLFTNILIE